MSHQRQIRLAEAEIARLHARVHETHRGRDKEAWRRAAAEFRAYRSPIDGLIDRTYSEDLRDDPELVRFAIDFLECDPHFFRSGYIKEHLLDKLKTVSLTEAQADRIRDVLVDAVVRRGQREFRRYCRLAVVLRSDELMSRLAELADGGDPTVVSRARLMLGYLGDVRGESGEPTQ